MDRAYWLQQDLEKEKRKVRDLEMELSVARSERDNFKNERDKFIRKLSEKTVEYENYKDIVIGKLDNLKYEISNL